MLSGRYAHIHHKSGQPPHIPGGVHADSSSSMPTDPPTDLRSGAPRASHPPADRCPPATLHTTHPVVLAGTNPYLRPPTHTRESTGWSWPRTPNRPGRTFNPAGKHRPPRPAARTGRPFPTTRRPACHDRSKSAPNQAAHIYSHVRITGGHAPTPARRIGHGHRTVTGPRTRGCAPRSSRRVAGSAKSAAGTTWHVASFTCTTTGPVTCPRTCGCCAGPATNE